MKPRRLKGDKRPEDQIREHYEVELALAERLRCSNKEQRSLGKLYTLVYDELYRRLPHHQQLTRKQSATDTAKALRWQYGMVGRFIKQDTHFLEVGPGDCCLSFQVAGVARQVTAVDISNIITEHQSVPKNFSLAISTGSDIPLPSHTVDVAYSNQLMEHLHPEDAYTQLSEIYRALIPGGRYICVTPNKVNGPWDISFCYDEAAQGLHLREYSLSELSALFKAVGFKNLRTYAGARGWYLRFPIALVVRLEAILSGMPFRIRSTLGRSLFIRSVLGIRLVGQK